MENIDPDTLLKKTAKAGMTGDFIISIVVHAVLIGVTSFGLFKAWTQWGVHSPSQIKMMEKAAAKEAAKAEAAAKAEEAKKAAEEAAAKAEEEAKAKGGDKAKAKAKVDEKAKGEDKAKGEEKAKGEDAPKPTPLDQQVEKPPKSFDLDAIDL